MSAEGVLDLAGVRRLYDRMAGIYDVATAPYRLVGGYRLVDRAVEALGIAAGDTVVDLGTGTGYALPALAQAVGGGGRVLGIDISARMLQRARQRCRRAGVEGVDLVQADIASYQVPDGTAHVMSAYAMEMVPDHDDVIAGLVQQLPAGGRLAVTGLRDPEGWPEWAVRFGSWINRPFGVATAYRAHRPWESVQRHAVDMTYTDILGGAVYLAVGTAPG